MSPKTNRPENREVVEREYKAYAEAAKKAREQAEKANAKKDGKKDGRS